MKILLAFVLILISISSFCQNQDLSVFQKHIESNGVEILEDFRKLLEIPNVAVDLPNINRNAELIKSELDKRGVETRLLRMVGTPPIVFGQYKVKDANRTIAFYVHYDGQPADASNWEHGPWEPTYYTGDMMEDGKERSFPKSFQEIEEQHRIYARSAGDDKGPVVSILSALDAINSSELSVTSNLVFFFEGQEEAGSQQLRNYLSDYKELMDEIDIWLFCDGPVHQTRKPQIVFGVRGVTGMELTVYGASRSLHSGHYGNWAPVPGQMLAELIATFKDEDGNIIIEDFLEQASPLSEEENKAIAAAPPVDEKLKSELGLTRTEGEGSIYERLALPSLTVRGLSSGNTGALTRNVIPSEAVASLGIRLVKGCEPERMQDLVETHIRKQGYYITRQEPTEEERLKYKKIVRIKRGNGYPAARTPMSNEYANMIVERAKDVAGEDLIVLPTLGGSLPLYLFTDVLDKPALVVPIANHDNNQHAPNENLRIGNLWYGIKLMGAIMTMEKIKL